MKPMLIPLVLCMAFTGIAQERTLETINYSGASLPLSKSIRLPEPGYLIAVADSLSRVNQVEVRFTDSISLRSDINAARVDFPGNISLLIHQRHGNATTLNGTIAIRFIPLDDVLEPNDLPEQGALVTINTWYQATLFPARDRDHFRVKLEKAGWLTPETREDRRSFAWEIFGEEGTSLGTVFPYQAKPGTYILGLQRNAHPDGPEPVHLKITVLPESDPLEPNDSVAVAIEMNKYHTVEFSTPRDIDRFLLKTAGKNYVTIRSYQVPSDQVKFSTTLHEKTYSGNPLVIPAGNKETEVIMTSAGELFHRPFFIRAEETARLDPNENNDSLPAATKLDKSRGVYFSVYPEGDEDWFHIKTKSGGRIILNLLDAVASHTRIQSYYRVELFDTARQSMEVAARETDRGVIYASGYLPTEGDWFLRITRRGPMEEEQLLALRVFGPGVAGSTPDDESFDDIFFIGFELDTSANMLLAALSESANANMVLVDSSASLEKVLNEVFAEAKRNRGARSWLPYALIGVALAGAGLYFYRKRITSRTRSKT